MQSIPQRWRRFSIFCFALLFHALFIDQGVGINLILAEACLLVGFYFFQGANPIHRNYLVTVGYLLSIFSMLWINSYYTLFLHIMCFFLYISTYSAFSKNLLELVIHAFLRILSFRDSKEEAVQHDQSVGYWMRLLVVPFIVVVVFFVLYANAIPYFLHFFNVVWTWLPAISVQSLLLLLIGIWVSWYTWKYFSPAKEDWNFISEIQLRVKNSQLRHLSPGLRNEYLQWLITLLCLIGLASLALIFDIRYIWLKSDFGSYDQAQWALRKGTGMLIVAILASLFFSLYVFRGNLYFFRPNAWLRKCTVVWLALNAFLCISLLVRTVLYIQEFNLAYKRIGVVLFIACALFAIGSIVYRLYRGKNMSFLLRVNLNMIFVTLLLSSCIHWDKHIVRYNLAHPQAYIDYDFLFTRDLDIVLQSEFSDEVLETRLQGVKSFSYLKQKYGRISYQDLINRRIQEWKEQQKSRDWRSWNANVTRVNKVLEE